MPNWSDVLLEINQDNQQHQIAAIQHQAAAQNALTTVRQKYLKALNKHTDRNVIAYYSGFLSKPPELRSDINDEDKNGFMMAIHRMKRMRGLDLILHTPGGDIASTQSIVHYLHAMFGNDIRAIIPQIAMSAGTMIACSCKEILMGKHSNLGPIDPQANGMPAYGVIAEFKRALREIKNDPASIAIWQPILSQFRPTFLGRCENAIDWSNKFVANQLRTVMFEAKLPADKKQSGIKANRIVKQLTDYTGNKTHNRHIHFEELQNMGLKVELLENDPALQDLVLTVHHCYMHTIMNSTAFKIIENHMGAAMIKNAAMDINGKPIPRAAALPTGD